LLKRNEFKHGEGETTVKGRKRGKFLGKIKSEMIIGIQ